MEVDEGEQEGEEGVQTQIDRLAAIVVLKQLLAKLVDDNDPQKPGEEKTKSCYQRGDSPVERA